MTKGNPRSSGYEIQPDQWYREPRRAVDALLDAEPFDGIVYDPACGGGNIPDACRARGIPFIGSDIVDRGWPGTIVMDFLGSRVPHDNIVTNPPFNLAVEFALHALGITLGKICILQRTSWLEGERRYQQLFRLNHLMRIWQFRSRLSMPPGGSGIEAKGGSVAYAWFVFRRNHGGPATLGWLP